VTFPWRFLGFETDVTGSGNVADGGEFDSGWDDRFGWIGRDGWRIDDEVAWTVSIVMNVKA